jgi:hypothetical protein
VGEVFHAAPRVQTPRTLKTTRHRDNPADKPTCWCRMAHLRLLSSKKLLDHRGMVQDFPLGALPHLQLGRAYAISGNMDKAKIAYQDFCTL